MHNKKYVTNGAFLGAKENTIDNRNIVWTSIYSGIN